MYDQIEAYVKNLNTLNIDIATTNYRRGRHSLILIFALFVW